MGQIRICSIAVMGLLTVTMHAQVAIRGTVQDPQGKPVDGATLVLYRPGSAATAAQTQSVNGEFVFPDTRAGEYLLEVTAEGFRRASVAVRSETATKVKLELAGVDQHVFVTAEGAAQTIDQVSKAANVIDAAELGQRNEYSLAEALRDTPGVSMRNLGGPGQATSVRMRGLRADATAVLIDGMRFRDSASISGDAAAFLSTFNVIAFDRVEVLRGSGSSLYGTNAVGGTVNVVSDAGGGALHGGLQTEGGSLGLLRGRGTLAGGVKDNRLTYSAGLLHLNVMSGVDGDDRARSTGAQTFLRYSARPGTSFGGRVFFSDDFVQPNLSPTTSGLPATNLPASTIVPAIPLAPDQVLRSAAGLSIVPGNATFIPNRNDPDNRRASRFWSGALTFRQALHPTAEWAASFQRVHTNRIGENGPAGPGFQPLVSNFSQFVGDIDTVDTKLQWRPRQWYAFTGGYEFEREGYFNLDDNRVTGPSAVRTRTKAEQRSNALYFANQLTLAQQRLQISVSGRAQMFSLDKPDFQYTGVVNNYAQAQTVTPPRALTGDVAVSYFVPRTGTKLRAHGGNSYRAPGLYERYGTGFFYNSFLNAVAFSPYGDPRLAPDRYNSIDGGVDQYLFGDRVRVSGTWFYTRTVQTTQFDSAANSVRPGLDPFGRTSGYYNGAGGSARGTELTVEMRPVRGTLVRSSYSYVNADTSQDSTVRGVWSALGIPAHSFQVFVNRQIGRKTDVTMDLFHSSKYLGPLFAGTRTRAYEFGGVTKIDAVVNRELWSGEKYKLKGYAKIDNMLHQRYFENGFLAPRATFLTGVQVLFQ